MDALRKKRLIAGAAVVLTIPSNNTVDNFSEILRRMGSLQVRFNAGLAAGKCSRDL